MVDWIEFNGSRYQWDEYVRGINGTFLQSFNWGEVKRLVGWNVLRIYLKSKDNIILPISILYRTRLGIVICWIPGLQLGIEDFLNDNFRKYISAKFSGKLIYIRLGYSGVEDEKPKEKLHSTLWLRPFFALNSGVTLMYKLQGNAGDRSKKLSSNWRHNLKRSEKYKLTVDIWENPDYKDISRLYREMEKIKDIPLQFSDQELKSAISLCKENLVVFRCLDQNGTLIAIRACSIFGNTAVDFLAASGATARRVYASYKLLWQTLEYCYSKGIEFYDLGGVDVERNMGVYNFKKGTGASLVKTLGEWDWSSLIGLRFVINIIFYIQANLRR